MNTKKLYLILGISLVTLGVVGGVFYLQKNSKDKTYGPDVLAIVDGKEITKDDEDKYDMENKRIMPVDEITQVLTKERRQKNVEKMIEEYIVLKEAEKNGLNVSQEEIDKEIKVVLATEDLEALPIEFVKTLRERWKITLLKKQIEDKKLAWAEGEFVSVRFDNKFENNATKTTFAEIEASVQGEKKQAETLSNSIYSDLISKKITFEQAIQRAETDPVLGKSAWGAGANTYTFSGKFTKEDSKGKLIYSSSTNFWEEVFNGKVGEILKPILVKITDPEFPTEPAHGAMYTIVRVDNLNKGEAGNYEEWLAKKKEEYKVKIFIK